VITVTKGHRSFSWVHGGSDVGGETVELGLGHGASIKVGGKKKGSNHSPKDWLEPKRSGKYTLVIGPQSNPEMVPLSGVTSHFRATLRPAQRKKRPCSHGRAGRGECVIMVFLWGSVSAKFGKTLATFGLPSPVEAFRVGPDGSHTWAAWPRSRRHSGWGCPSCWRAWENFTR
jgi:hypothetical protein